MADTAPVRPLRPPDVSAPAGPPPASDEHAGADGAHRRLLVGSLVVRRVTYRSVLRVAWPFFAALYAAALALGAAAWNVAALAGWDPGRDGVGVIWTALALGIVVVPVLVVLALALVALYNLVSERCGGVEVAVVSPRRYRADGRRH